MSNVVKLKRSAVASKVPATTDLALGELALNTYDGNLFFKKSVSSTDSIVTVATLDGTQTLTNKTLTQPTISGGLKDKDGSRGTSGQLLASTGTGVQWVNGSGTAGGILYVFARAATLSVVVNIGNLAVVGRAGTVNVTI